MTESKICSTSEAKALIARWRTQEDQQVVFTNGCFDILHLGHVDYLEKASQKGTKLVLGLNTDQSVSRLKGPSRPVVPEYARARVMAALAFIDLVVFFNEDTPLQLIQQLNPDVLVKGNDYQVNNIVGADHVIERGGKVETIPLVKGFSTSSIIEKISASKQG